MSQNDEITLTVNDNLYLARGSENDKEAKWYSTYIQKVGDEWISIPTPSRRGRFLGVAEKDCLYIYAVRGDALYMGQSGVLQKHLSDNIPTLKLSIPSSFTRVQRREYFRWECALPVQWEKEICEEEDSGPPSGRGTTIDLSAGGILLKTCDQLEVGESYLLTLTLDRRQLSTNGRVVRRKENTDKETSFALEFIDIDEKARDTITAYIFHQQMEMRRRGLK